MNRREFVGTAGAATAALVTGETLAGAKPKIREIYVNRNHVVSFFMYGTEMTELVLTNGRILVAMPFREVHDRFLHVENLRATFVALPELLPPNK